MKVYLDYNATTPLDERVIEAMKDAMQRYPANPSSLHSQGQEARIAIENARRILADSINAEPDEIIFTGSGTESDNLAIHGALRAYKKKGNHLIVSKIEHPAVYNTAKALKDYGFDVDFVGVDSEGRVIIDELKSLIKDTTVIVSIMHANNEIGTIQDLKSIVELCHSKGVLVHTDAVQSYGKIKIDVKDLGVDFLSTSAHKIYGPKGIGMLYKKNGVAILPVIHGGHHEKGLRPGTYATHNIIGFSEAVKITMNEMEEENKRLSSMITYLREGIKNRISHIKINSPQKNVLPNTLNVSIEFVEGESLLLELDMKGIALSTGSACASGSLEPSHVLLAIGVPVEIAHGSLRISIGKYTRKEDIDYFLEELPKVVERLRKMSPLYNQ